MMFDSIAPIYGLFYNYQKKMYGSVLEKVEKVLKMDQYKSVLDVGCGTGALCSVLADRGMDVTGVDPAGKMLAIAMKKQKGKGITLIKANVLGGLPFEDDSFDIAIASYVAHGMDSKDRKILYAEMGRVARHLAIICDYNQNRSRMTDFIESLEKGDYFNFIKDARCEMNEAFREVRVIDVAKRAALYICKPVSGE